MLLLVQMKDKKSVHLNFEIGGQKPHKKRGDIKEP